MHPRPLDQIAVTRHRSTCASSISISFFSEIDGHISRKQQIIGEKVLDHAALQPKQMMNVSLR
jgi:hypothetical protein